MLNLGELTNSKVDLAGRERVTGIREKRNTTFFYEKED